MKKLLLVANVAKEHINKFHLPTIRYFKSQGWRVDIACNGVEDVPGCDHQYRGKWSRSPFRFCTFLGILQLRNILQQVEYDVVYCHTPVGGLVARLAVATLKKRPKVAYFVHGFYFCKSGPRFAWLIGYPIEKLLSHYTDLLITLNTEDYALAKKKMAPGAKVIYSPGIGVDFSRLSVENFASTRTLHRANFGVTSKIVLMYIAELCSRKNQGMLLVVLKRLLEKRGDIVLILVGPDHTHGRFLREAKRLGIDDRVIFTGWRSDIGSLLSMADIYVASSIREGLAVNLIEAMYMGLPIVATRGRGQDEVIENYKNGFLVPQNDVEAMVNRILHIADRATMRGSAPVTMGKYNADAIAETLYAEINILI